jgi:hypothetical protein
MTTQMKRRSGRLFQSGWRGAFGASVLISTLVLSHNAHATPYLFKETELGLTETFTVDSHPSVSGYSLRNDFELTGVLVTRNGVTTTDTLLFSSSNLGGGYSDAVAVPYIPYVVNDFGPQLYTGAESSPTFIIGTTMGTDHETGMPYTLMIASVPEPPSLFVFMGAIGLLLARRGPSGQTASIRS